MKILKHGYVDSRGTSLQQWYFDIRSATINRTRPGGYGLDVLKLWCVFRPKPPGHTWCGLAVCVRLRAGESTATKPHSHRLPKHVRHTRNTIRRQETNNLWRSSPCFVGGSMIQDVPSGHSDRYIHMSAAIWLCSIPNTSGATVRGLRHLGG